WPYGELFGSPQEYQVKVLPDRRDHLRNEYKEALLKPEFVFCYGKGLRGEHRKIFDFIDFRSEMDDAIEWGSNQHSVFILTKMFGYGRLGFTEDFVDRLCSFALTKSPK
ncbi:MAG: hypothetical protein J4O05_06930, partial [Chloroflexi bacterium]|nr:hypothetical protein [Chloroflexota bacterium]